MCICIVIAVCAFSYRIHINSDDHRQKEGEQFRLLSEVVELPFTDRQNARVLASICFAFRKSTLFEIFHVSDRSGQ